MRKATKVCLFLISHGKKECRPFKIMNCPRCGKTICDCLFRHPGFLARAVGKQLSRLSGCKAGSPSTTKAGLSAGTGDKPLDTSVKVKERDDDWDQTPEEICQQIIGLVPWADGETVLEPFRGDGNFYDNLPRCVAEGLVRDQGGAGLLSIRRPEARHHHHQPAVSGQGGRQQPGRSLPRTLPPAGTEAR